MIIKDINTLSCFIAEDGSTLKEILPPYNDNNDTSLKLPYSLAYAEIKGQQQSTPQRLHQSTEIYIILKGTAMMHINDDTQHVQANTVIIIPPNSIQYIEIISDHTLRFVCLVSPPYHPSNDNHIE